MFDNLLFQAAGAQLAGDLRNGVLPNALLFAGPVSSGKLTCALELARVLSCAGTPAGRWLCDCPSCLRHKALAATSLLLAGPRSCTLEIAAASRTLIDAASSGASHLSAARYLFVRSVRKLTLRFSPVLWEGDDKVPKISPVLGGIDELLEELDPARPLPELSRLEKICASVKPLCARLEGDFMYDSIPVAQVRRASGWARYRSGAGRKVLVLENADRMQESVRNALLKILEEPPEDVVLVLTTARRNAVMPTILSRVRTYSFSERSAAAQAEVVRKVFHAEPELSAPLTVDSFLQSFLPVEPSVCTACGRGFVSALAEGTMPDIGSVVKSCGNFEPRLLLGVFLGGMTELFRDLAAGKAAPPGAGVSSGFGVPGNRPLLAELSAEGVRAVRDCMGRVSAYNQGPAAALELLASDLLSAFRKYGIGARV